MRAFALCLIASVMVSGAFSAACTTIPGGTLYASAGSCAAYTMCGTQFCSCIGSSQTTPNTCLATAANGTTCQKIQSCLATYTMCIEHVPSASAGCSTLNTTLRMSYMNVAVTGYVNSTLQRSCRNRVCSIMNATAQVCDFGHDDVNVCMWVAPPTTAAPTNASNTSMAPSTSMAPQSTNPAPAGFVAAITALLVIDGQDFNLIQADPVKWAALKDAVSADIARLLGLDPTHVYVIRMWVASLHIEFAIAAAAGVAPDVLASQLAAVGTNTSWLQSVKAEYAKVSNGTLTMRPIVVTQTAAPGLVTPVPPTPAPGSISASNGVVSAVAAVVAVAAAVFAL